VNVIVSDANAGEGIVNIADVTPVKSSERRRMQSLHFTPGYSTDRSGSCRDTLRKAIIVVTGTASGSGAVMNKYLMSLIEASSHYSHFGYFSA